MHGTRQTGPPDQVTSSFDELAATPGRSNSQAMGGRRSREVWGGEVSGGTKVPGRCAAGLLYGGCVLAAMMPPATVTLVPTYIFFNKIGWIDSFKPLVRTAWFGSPFFIVLLRQFYLGLPRELEESAAIDGAGQFYIFFNIVFPLLKTIIATCLLYTSPSPRNS